MVKLHQFLTDGQANVVLRTWKILQNFIESFPHNQCKCYNGRRLETIWWCQANYMGLPTSGMCHIVLFCIIQRPLSDSNTPPMRACENYRYHFSITYVTTKVEYQKQEKLAKSAKIHIFWQPVPSVSSLLDSCYYLQEYNYFTFHFHIDMPSLGYNNNSPIIITEQEIKHNINLLNFYELCTKMAQKWEGVTYIWWVFWVYLLFDW